MNQIMIIKLSLQIIIIDIYLRNYNAILNIVLRFFMMNACIRFEIYIRIVTQIIQKLR